MFLFPSSLALGLSLFSIASITSACLFDSQIAAAPIATMTIANTTSAMSSDSQPEDSAATKSAIESAITSNNRIFFVYVGVLVIGAILTVMLFNSGNRVQEAMKADADARLKSSEVKINSLTAETEKATSEIIKGQIDLAQAQKGIALVQTAAAEANARASKLEHHNLDLRITVATLEKQAADAGKDLAGLQIAVADAKRRQAEAETKLALVSIRQLPRALRIPISKMLSILKTAPPAKVIILYQEADAESSLFADWLRLRLADAGWQILSTKAIHSTTVFGATTQGDIYFVMRDQRAGWSSASIQALNKALREGEMIVSGFSSNFTDDTVRIVIAPKQ